MFDFEFYFAASTCGDGRFECTSGECIMLDWTCDNQFDCFDGSDERDCREYSGLEVFTENISTLSVPVYSLILLMYTLDTFVSLYHPCIVLVISEVL